MADTATTVEQLGIQSRSSSTDLTDLKKVTSDLATSIAMLNQGMQLLLADRASLPKEGSSAQIPENSVAVVARIGVAMIPENNVPPSLRFQESNPLSPTMNAPRVPLPFTQTHQAYKMPKEEFPVFNGTGVRNWLQKVHRFFLVHPIPPGQKVLYASLAFQGKVEAWYITDAGLLERMPWAEFAFILNSRFSEEICENVVGEFSKLMQTDTVQAYQEKFEELHPLMLQRNPGLSERFFVDSFMSGLNPE